MLELAEIEDGLVEEGELAGIEGGVQLGAQHQAVVGGHLHGLFEHDGLVASGALGPVQGDVGVAAAGPGPLDGPRDADAGRTAIGMVSNPST